MRALAIVAGLLSLSTVFWGEDVRAQSSGRTITAEVVALDQCFFWNRLGAMQPQGMIYALKHDVDFSNPDNPRLKYYKRPRPIVLRMNVGDRLVIKFENHLRPGTPVDNEQPVDNEEPATSKQPATRTASIHVVGMQLVNSIADDGSNVGENASSLAAPGGGTATYELFAEREGVHHIYSAAAQTGGEGDGGSMNAGLFGAINVEPQGSVWYRSQVTEEDLALATTGTTPGGQPILDYDMLYANGPRAGLPVFKILDANNAIKHSDLTAIIDPRQSPEYPPNPEYEVAGGKRNDPFREFTIMYHDEIGAVQAFPLFDDPEFKRTLHSVRDAFAINYGTGGIGAEIIANRLGVGPMWDCTDCKYEEFFLTSWAVGDPAMVVDVPANAKDAQGDLITGPKATKALYPDDPSNVYHSYLKDHVKFRILHGGSKEHHIHHLHAHQWLFSPDSDNSAYLDSQAFGPGSAFTLEMVYNGSGNRNQTVGDSIFHCHFYPHFAQGMWSLWRVHDVFEDGSRRLPDGEIVAGTPIPAVVPMRGLPMAPMPQADVAIVPADANGDGVPDSSQAEVTFIDRDGDGKPDPGNPGYPFFIPGVAGHRPPHPPLDTIWDGGLPRHVVVSDPGNEIDEVHTPFDFTHIIMKMKANELPETGTAVELAAMDFHAIREHDSFKQDGTPAKFIANGLPPQPGAPFADPCIDDYGNAVGRPLRYKAAVVQIDAVINKVGWHFPQMRILTLWDDVEDTLNGTRAPEPLFFRANSGDCIEFQHTNLVPNIYELDDFQVRTPTDILGQHIHLVKFDVTSSDGSANGWNYEDGTFSPDEVRERIEALNDFFPMGHPNDGKSALMKPDGTFHDYLAVKEHPDLKGDANQGDFLGAQTTVQRWYADDVLNLNRDNRTLRTVFTHDHFGPSTHQQAGLYSALVVEPEGSIWRDPTTGQEMGGRTDGGPTSWRADILTGPDGADSYREFLVEFADFQLAYRAGSHPELPSAGGPVIPEQWGADVPRTSGEGFSNLAFAINPPGKIEAELPFLLKPPPKHLFSEAISADDVGTFSLNYRNEPIPLRVLDPQTGKQATGAGADALRGDLSHVYRSDVNRAIPELNDPPAQWPYGGGSASVGAEAGDPFTPLLRAYNNDQIQIRVLVGATEEGHNFNVNGMNWLFEPSWTNSGYRSSQMMGISEHFEFINRLTPIPGQKKIADRLYQPSASVGGQWNGVWGLLRSYETQQPNLPTLPNNENIGAVSAKNAAYFNGPCPRSSPVKKFDVTAVQAADVLPGGQLVYNSRIGAASVGPLNDPTAILYVLTSDLNADGTLKAGVPIEPLVLRANAGDCIEVTLRNRLPETLHGPDPAFPQEETEDLAGFSTLPMIIEKFNANQIRPSSHVGLHAQLLSYDVTQADGKNVGMNPGQTVAPMGKKTYRWYAGNLDLDSKGHLTATPVEFGAVNLISSDPIKHSNKGAGAALIIEPKGSTWKTDWDLGINRKSRLAATVTPPASAEPFREFVTVFQDDINLRYGNGDAVKLLAESEDPEDSGQKAINYRTEPAWFRLGFAPDALLKETRKRTDLDTFVSNSAIGGDPETPVFTASAGTPVRFRVLEPGGHARNHVFAVHGHVWQTLPYTQDSTVIGENRDAQGRWLTMFEGARMGHGPTNHFDAILQNGAGGAFKVPGDYLYRDMPSFMFDGGLWGVFRVTPEVSPPVPPPNPQPDCCCHGNRILRRGRWFFHGGVFRRR